MMLDQHPSGWHPRVIEISAYLDNELSAEARGDLEHHLNACPVCHVVYDTLAQTVQIYQSIDAQQIMLPPEVEARLIARLLQHQRRTTMTTTTGTYGFGVELDLPYEQAIEQITAALKAEGFGVLTTIDVRQTMKQKLDIDFEPYTILGACNPQLAHRALKVDHMIGLLLPCNVIVHAHGNRTRVDVADPIVMLGIVRNEELGSIAKDAAQRLHRALDHIATAVVHESADQG